MADASSIANETLKRITVPVYPTDPGKHLNYFDELRSHLHLLPDAIPGYKHDLVLAGRPTRWIDPPAGHNDPANPIRPAGDPNAGKILNPQFPAGPVGGRPSFFCTCPGWPELLQPT